MRKGGVNVPNNMPSDKITIIPCNISHMVRNYEGGNVYVYLHTVCGKTYQLKHTVEEVTRAVEKSSMGGWVAFSIFKSL